MVKINTTGVCGLWSVIFVVRWDAYAVISLEAVAYSLYCNTVKWFYWD